jgi:hypothetical protein
MFQVKNFKKNLLVMRGADSAKNSQIIINIQ